MLTDYCIVWEEKTPGVYTMVCTLPLGLFALPPALITLGDVYLNPGV